jgi:hypothetical protein
MFSACAKNRLQHIARTVGKTTHLNLQSFRALRLPHVGINARGDNFFRAMVKGKRQLIASLGIVPETKFTSPPDGFSDALPA